MRRRRDVGLASRRRPGSASPRPPARRPCSACWAWREPRWPPPEARSGRGAAPGRPRSPATTRHCQLGNGVKHVVELTFDNVHYFRDNPNVPSDLELMPNLLNFFENNGTFLSNNHTPLIAHTADDILTTYTGLYGDRQGMPISNSYQAYNTDGRRSTPPTPRAPSRTGPIRSSTRHPRRTPGTTPTRHGLLAGAAGHGPPRGGAEHDHPGALGAVHPGRLQRRRRGHGQPGTREHRRRHPEGVRPQLAGGPAARRRPGLVQGRGDRGLRRHRRALRQGRRLLRHRQGGQVRADRPVADRLARPAAGRAGRVQRLPGAVRAPVRRPAARRRHPEPDAQRLPGHQRGREPGRPERQPDQRRVPRQPPRASPASAPSTRRRPWPTWPTCWNPASRW